MARYSFTVRKNDCEVNLTTDDRNAIEQQIAIWVLALSRKPLVQTIEPSDDVATEVPSADISTQDSVEDLLTEAPVVKPFVPEKIVTPVAKVQEYVEEFIKTVEPESVVDDKKVEVASEKVEEPKQDSFMESNVASMQPLSNDVAVTLNSLFNAESPTSADFESILEKSVDNISQDSSNVVKKDENFCKLVKANNITDRLELLLFTADYFCKYDARFVFSLKQINGKLMHNLAVIVDHGILKIAIDNNYLERVGDSEYRLTEYGRSEIYSKAGIWS